MKKFNELTKDQQEEAVEYAEKEIEKAIEDGTITVMATKDMIKEWALMAAEDAHYPEFGDKVVYNIAENFDKELAVFHHVSDPNGDGT